MESSDFLKYRAEVLKLNKPRRGKDTKTLYSKAIIRRIKHKQKLIVNEDIYSKIIRRINELLADSLFEGDTISFPNKMGYITIYKYQTSITFQDGKLKRNMPVDWDKTLKAWFKDDKLRQNKVLVRNLPNGVYRIQYTVPKRSYKNQTFYKFQPAKALKTRLKNLIKSNKGVPAYEYGFYNN